MRPDDRAVSEVLGYALVFALVIATVGVVTVAGLGELQETRNVEQINNAQRAFDLLTTNMDDLAERGAPSRSTEMRLADAQLDVSNPAAISFRGIDDDTPSNNFTDSYDVWPIIYRSSTSEATVMYTGGAVLRTRGDDGVAVRKPSLVASNGRLVVPLVQTRSQSTQSIGGATARVRTTRSGVELLASDTTGLYDKVFLNVTSPRAGVWEDTLSEYPDLSCTLDTSGGTDRVWCVTTDPERVHVSAVRVDVALSD
jgi:hypothetical protein